MNVAIGCPVTNRAWILPRWFDHVYEACNQADVDPFFMFVCGTSEDRTSFIIQDRMSYGIVETVDEKGSQGKVRGWNIDRYHQMVKVRNSLLSLARDTGPDYLLSLDSDILLHPDALKCLLESIEDKPAIGGKCYLTAEGYHAPNYAHLHSDYGLYRPDRTGDIFRVDVIMAIKLMTSAAYHVDYKVDRQGEDIGWSKNCREAGLDLWHDSRVCSKHVMERHQLDEVDPRCGY